ncbi:hypothetical protein B0E55_06101 [Rhodococcus sp. 66b]|nr:hypothetical protein B0E55_06101 [Rhodococcus sp. 66b]
MGCNGFLHCFGEVVPQMPAVCNLGRSGTGGFGIRAGAVAADHLCSRMFGEPVGDGAGLPVGENIDSGGACPYRSGQSHTDAAFAV